MDYTKEIEAIVKAGESVQLRVHKLLNTMAANWIKSGDVRPVVTGVNLLLEKFPRGLRSNAIKAWVEHFFGFIMNAETKQFVAGKRKAISLDLHAIKNIRWWEFKPEPEYQPITDFNKLLSGLIAKAEKDVKELGEKSVVDPELLAALKAVKPVNTVPA